VQHYRTRDARFVALVMVDADRHWVNLCETIGAPDLAADPRFVDRHARRTNARACVERLDEVFAQRDLADWCRILDHATGVWAPVREPAELPDDPQVDVNGYLGQADLGDGGSLPMVTSPMQFDGTATPPRRAPEHGEHTEEVLLALGLTWNEISELKAAEVVN
jgi:crotonobetainyl-CoA:carnitine CoA-transferase CaiB-like acyl-CoA transferase